VTGDAGGGPHRIMRGAIDDAVLRFLVRLDLRVIPADVTGGTGLRLAGLFRGEPVADVAVAAPPDAPVLEALADVVAPQAPLALHFGCLGEKFGIGLRHDLGDGMSLVLELADLLRVAGRTFPGRHLTGHPDHLLMVRSVTILATHPTGEVDRFPPLLNQPGVSSSLQVGGPGVTGKTVGLRAAGDKGRTGPEGAEGNAHRQEEENAEGCGREKKALSLGADWVG